MNNMALTNKAEQLIMGGDLKGLDTNERLAYVKKICDDMGLNPYTKPFEYITLNGKLTLYARKDCTDQLRKIHKVSITRVDTEIVGDCYVVTAYAESAGRVDSDVGVVSIAGLKGDGMANALMKAQTKAKRRVTLSICGLGMLDETELETIPIKDVLPVTEKFTQVAGDGFYPKDVMPATDKISNLVDEYGECVTSVPNVQQLSSRALSEKIHDDELESPLDILLEVIANSQGMDELREHYTNADRLIKSLISKDRQELWRARFDAVKDPLKDKFMKGVK